jgi:SulP family sulfate permease
MLVGGMDELQFLPHWVGLPLNLEGLALVPRIVATALAIALLGMLEAVSIAKSLAARSGQRIDPDQELIGMGAANILCSAFGAMPGSASFLRSAANLQSGAR